MAKPLNTKVKFIVEFTQKELEEAVGYKISNNDMRDIQTMLDCSEYLYDKVKEEISDWCAAQENK